MDKTIRVWDARTLKSATTIKTAEENLRIVWHPSMNYVAVLDHNDDIDVYDLRRASSSSSKSKMTPAASFHGKSQVNQIRWTPSGRHLLVTTRSGKV